MNDAADLLRTEAKALLESAVDHERCAVKADQEAAQYRSTAARRRALADAYVKAATLLEPEQVTGEPTETEGKDAA
jgi:hypothetical protein